MKIKSFVAREIQYFKIRIFSFNSYVYYLARGFTASTRAFNFLSRAFNLATRAFSLLTGGFELVTPGFELVTRKLELVTRGFEHVTRNSCFTFPPISHIFIAKQLKEFNPKLEVLTRVLIKSIYDLKL